MSHYHPIWRSAESARAFYGCSQATLGNWSREGKVLRKPSPKDRRANVYATAPDFWAELEAPVPIARVDLCADCDKPINACECQCPDCLLFLDECECDFEWVDESPAEEDAEDAPADSLPDALLLSPDDGWVERRGYVYDGGRQVYIISTPSTGGQTVITATKLMAIWQAWTGDSRLTGAEVCREFGLTEATWQELKSALRLTHTRAPWPDEHIASTPSDDLVEDAIKRKEQAVLQKVQRIKWKQVVDDADKWRNLRRSLLDWIGGSVRPTHLPSVEVGQGAVHYLLGASDIHVGKRTHNHPNETLDEQCERLADVLGRACAHIIGCRDAASVVVPIGSDGLHSDTKHLTTTRGTPQGAQSIGSIYQQFNAYVSLMAGVISRLSEYMPVKCVWIRGNHDEVLSYTAAATLAAQFGHNRGVDFDLDELSRKLVRCGDTPLLLAHGDKLKDNALPAIISQMVPQDMNIRNAVMARGHVHHAKAYHHEIGGYDVLTLSSPAKGDDWHHESGYDLAQHRVTVAALSGGLQGVRWFKLDGGE